jgi:hypothetical protein
MHAKTIKNFHFVIMVDINFNSRIWAKPEYRLLKFIKTILVIDICFKLKVFIGDNLATAAFIMLLAEELVAPGLYSR